MDVRLKDLLTGLSVRNLLPKLVGSLRAGYT